MYNIQNDLGNYFFKPILNPDGSFYGVLAFKGTMPPQHELDELFRKHAAPGNPDWSSYNVIGELAQLGFDAGMVVCEEPMFIS